MKKLKDIENLKLYVLCIVVVIVFIIVIYLLFSSSSNTEVVLEAPKTNEVAKPSENKVAIDEKKVLALQQSNQNAQPQQDTKPSTIEQSQQNTQTKHIQLQEPNQSQESILQPAIDIDKLRNFNNSQTNTSQTNVAPQSLQTNQPIIVSHNDAKPIKQESPTIDIEPAVIHNPNNLPRAEIEKRDREIRAFLKSIQSQITLRGNTFSYHNNIYHIGDKLEGYEIEDINSVYIRFIDNATALHYNLRFLLLGVQ